MSLGERFYRALLWAYPRQFRERYHNELIAFFRDERRHARYQRPGIGFLLFWLKTTIDLTRSSFRQRLYVSSPTYVLELSPERRTMGDKMQSVLQDVGYALRSMIKRPAFTLVVLFTLALGIGANAAIFSVLYNVVFKSLPYEDPENLVMVWEHNYPRSRETNVVSGANFAAWSEQSTSFEALAALTEYSATLTGEGEPERVGVVSASSTFFPLVGVQAQRGRVFLPTDDVAEGARLAVLTHEFWQRRFGGDPNVIGRTITLNGSVVEVIGILPRGFEFDLTYTFNPTGRQDLWIPQLVPDELREARGRWLQVLGRLAPGVSLASAQSQMSTLAGRLEQEFPEYQTGWGVRIVRLQQQIVGDARSALLILFGAVSFVLLIACANVANLLLSRSSGRQQEIAVRTALGAGRGRVIQQLLTENTLLAIGGGVLGLLLAFGAVSALATLGPENLPRLETIGINGVVIVFTLGASLLTGLLFGLLPAIRLSGFDLKNALTEGGMRGGHGVRHRRTRDALVIAEIALSLMLLVGAGLLLRSFAKLLDTGVGFPTENIVSAQLQLHSSAYPDEQQRVRTFEDLVERVVALPGVTAASAISGLPLAGPATGTSFWVNDRPIPADGEHPVADIRWVHRDYHRTMGIQLVDGRAFSQADTDDSPLVVVISEFAANEFWPNESAIGKTLSMPWGDTLVAEIVGVVGDVRHNGPSEEPRSMIYWHHVQFPMNNMAIVARTAVEPFSVVSAIRREVAQIDPDLPIYSVRTMDSYLSDAVAPARFSMLALGLFAVVAVLLASIGIYGVMSYSVAQRTRELGIKMALGAGGTNLLLQVVKDGLILIAIAAALGIGGALALSRFMSQMVFEVSPTDPITIVGVTGLLVTVALLACYLPARRASRVDPMVALRHE